MAADILSRISAITMPDAIDYNSIAQAQFEDSELASLLTSGSSLQLKKITMPNSSIEVVCDFSTGTARPYIPKDHRYQVFMVMHNLAHPGVRRTSNLIKKRFVWPSISSDIAKWTRCCIASQKSKVHRHTKAPLSVFKEPLQRFEHVHLDIIGPLPPSNGFTYCLTMIDRFSRWPEVQPLRDMTAETVADAFFSCWVSRYGCPSIITTDQGRQFESSLFHALTKFLGAKRSRTTAYHPQSNGLIEELHRPLKAAIKCYATQRWTEVLPSVLLGLRSALKEDLQCTPAELLFGSTIRLPGEFFDTSKSDGDPADFINRLKTRMQEIQPRPPKHHGTRATFIHPLLPTSSHVFLRRDMVKPPFQQPYDGPYLVLSRSEKTFDLDLKGKSTTVSIDRLKPAFLLNESDSMRENNALVLPPKPPEQMQSCNKQTRSGRVVRFPDWYR